MNKSDYKELNLKNGADRRPVPATETAASAAPGKKSAKKIRNIILILAVIAAAAIFIRIQFGPAILWADISGYEEEQILVTGLLEEDFYITPKELSELKMFRTTATGNSEKAGTIKAVGPTLETFLEKYGKKPEDFAQVKFYASDDYNVVLVKSLYEKDVVLSIANGKEPLDEWQQPLRIVIPEDDSGNWVRMVTKMEFTPN